MVFLSTMSTRGIATPILWRQPLNGSRPRQLTRFSSQDELQDFAWTRNGDKLAYIQGRAQSDVILFQTPRR